MRKFNRSVLLATTVVIATLPSPAFAFGADGHEIIATVARDRLVARNPALANRFQAILANNILLERQTSRSGRTRTCRASNLREIAAWPDCVRTMRGYTQTGDFHFDDIPLCTDIAAPRPMPPKESYCPGGDCATAAIDRYVAQLRDRGSSPRLRAEALSFIIHFVGDLHQPLHAETNRDRGGNGVSITVAPGAIPGFTRSVDNLHSFWDTHMVFAATGFGETAIRQVRELADANAVQWRQPNSEMWVRESHSLARRAYEALPREPACNAGAADGGELGASYVALFRSDVREQLAKAAVHLTDILERALS